MCLSLYNSIFNLNDENDSRTKIIRSINGHVDNDTLSKCYDLEYYSSISKSHSTPFIHFLHVNISTTRKCFYNLKALISSLPSQSDLIALSETWLSDNTTFLYELEGYSSFHVVRTAREHGGVSIYVRNIHQSNLIHELSFVNITIEICTAKVTLSNLTLTVSAIYRSHTKYEDIDNFADQMSVILNNAIYKNMKSVLLRDFNINLLEHSTHRKTENYLNTMQSLSYFSYISRPTRFPDTNDNTAPSLLDNI